MVGVVAEAGHEDDWRVGGVLFGGDEDLVSAVLRHFDIGDDEIEAGVIDALSKGVVLEEGRTQPAVVRVAGTKRGRTVVEIELREGRKRQIRRMFGLFGNEVRRLKRMRFGPLELGALPAGKWRILQPAEIHELREAVGLPDRGAEGETA